MVVGSITEDLESKRNRHIQETEQDKNGWERELEYAIKRNDTNYGRYCEIMISICDNTLEKLKSFEIY